MNSKASRNAPECFRFEDDGLIPNNPTLAFVVFRRAIEVDGSADPEATIEQIFQNHGLGRALAEWRLPFRALPFPYP